MDRGIFAGWARACVSLSAQVLLDVVRISVNALKGPDTGVLGVGGGVGRTGAGRIVRREG